MSGFTGSLGDFDREVSYSRSGAGRTSIGDVSFTQRPKKTVSDSQLNSTADPDFASEPGSDALRIKGLSSATAEGVYVGKADRAGNVVGLEKLTGLAGAREALMRKKFSPVGLSDHEKQQLDYVSWQIDRIEHSRLAGDLSDLEKLADIHEEFAEQVKTLKDSVTEVLHPGRDRH